MDEANTETAAPAAAETAAPAAAETAAPAAAAATAAPAAATAAPAAGTDWIAGLDDAGRQLATSKGWKTPGDALTNYMQLESALGYEKVALPPKGADGGRDWESWDGWAELGRPEAPENYEFKTIPDMPETDSDLKLRAAIAPAAHKAGLAPWQLDQLTDAWNGHFLETAKQAEADAAKDIDGLKTEMGGDFDQEMARANRVARLAFGEEIVNAKNIKLSDGRFLLDDAGLARAFAKIGALIGEDGELAEGLPAKGLAIEPAAAEAEIQTIRAAAHDNPLHALNDRAHPEHEALHARLAELYRLAEAKQTSGATV